MPANIASGIACTISVAISLGGVSRSDRRISFHSAQMNVGQLGRLVVAIDAREVLEFSAPRFGV